MSLGVRPWIGYDGGYPLEGPPEEPCQSCDRTRRQHDSTRSLTPRSYNAPECWGFHGFEEDRRRMLCAAPSMVVTMWVCHACGADNDVWGEGALHSWMECGTCFASSFLEWAIEMDDSKIPQGSEVESVLACG